MNMKLTKTNLLDKHKDDGFASIIIAIVLVLVLSLVTVGFAELMRKETRSSLDRQLSTQAYFAAETGVNDAAKAINDGYSSAKTSCAPLTAPQIGGAKYLTDNTISTATNTSYTCLTIDPAPFKLVYGAIDFSQSKAVTITGVDPNNPAATVPIGSINISWKDTAAKGFVSGGAHNFETAAAWTYTGLMRIGLTPLSLNAGKLTRADLIDNTATIFMYPNAKAGAGDKSIAAYNTAPYNSYVRADSGGIVDGNCNPGSQPLFCNVTITGLDKVSYLLDMRSIYSPNTVNVTAYDSSKKPIRIKNAQTLVDSTGKSQDVLRRIQVRIPSHPEFFHSDFSLESAGDICKQMRLYPDPSVGISDNICDL